MSKGQNLELYYSKRIHETEYPLLLSSLVLRSYNCGQIDIGAINKKQREWVVRLYEIKRSPRLSDKQRRRLLKTVNFLSSILAVYVELSMISNGRTYRII